MRSIAVITTSRSEYGIYVPLLDKIRDDPDLSLQLIVGGMHLSPEFGLTAQMIELDGFEINERVEMLLSSDSPEGIAKSMGLGTIGFAQAYSRLRPDILVTLGDRFEMHAAVVAALPFKIPVAHISGGESTEGSIDELIRHSITKMSHLHFASTELYRQRIIQMGEDPWRVIVTGALNLDNLKRENLFNLSNLKMAYGIEPTDPILLVTYHPVTLEYEHTRMQMRELLSALEETNFNIIFTYPNADTSSRIIIEMINKFVRKNKNSQMAINLGTQAYFGLMRCASAMVGNSSSGIIEAASFGLPVVNIGNRQSGRVRGKNVIDVGYEKAEILSGINKATSLEFRNEIENLINPYGSGNASEKIIDKLKNIKIDNNLLIKKFHQMSSK